MGKHKMNNKFISVFKRDENSLIQEWGIMIINYLGSVELYISIGSFHINIRLWGNVKNEQ